MNARRIIGSVLATVLASSTLGVIASSAAPASAAETVPTRIVPGVDGRGVISSSSRPLTYGDSVSIAVNVEGFIGGAWTTIYNGPVSVTRQVAGSSKVDVLAEVSSAYVYDSKSKARGRAVYNVYYGGGTGGYPVVNYAPTSATYTLTGVQRDLNVSTMSGRKAGFKGKLSPAKKIKIVVFKKKGKKFRKYKVVRSTAKGRYTVVLPAPRRGRFHWKIVFNGDKLFAGSVVKGSTYKR